jgi:transposase
MRGLSYKEKIKVYKAKKNGMSYTAIKDKYNINATNARYIINIIDKHGYNVLKRNGNAKYTKEFMQKAIDRVVKNYESVNSVSIDLGLSGESLLRRWVKNYKKNSYNIVECEKGQLTMKDIIESNPKDIKETLEQKIKRLEKENTYLKAEIEYSKKLEAVVLARKNRQQKKK